MADKADYEYSELKKRALLAKQRLKMGYWQRMYDEKQRALTQMGESGDNVRLVNDLQYEKLRRDESMAYNSVKANEEEIFYDKVCSILEEDENTTNPIGQLINKEEFDKLDSDNRQRYILKLSQKFREMRERYYRERASKSV